MKNKRKIIIYFLSPIIIFIILSFGMKDILTIHVASDEFGYWTAAANFAGYDWSDCASYNQYYSFGYGMLLTPLIFIKDPIITYKASLYLNCFFVIISYFILFQFIKTMIPTVSHLVQSIISFAVNLYSGLIFYSKETIAECLLWMLFILSAFLIQKYVITKRQRYFLAASIVNIYMLWVHMRTIGVLIALIICFCIYAIRFDKKLLKNVWVLGGVVIGFLCLYYFKSSLKSNQYTTTILVGNELGGQVEKIRSLLSIEGTKKFLLNVCGRLWYLGNSTYFLFYIGIYACVKHTVNCFWKREKEFFLYAYLILSVLFAIGVSALFMLEIQDGRRDTLFYGRYSEYVIAPILVLGIRELAGGLKIRKGLYLVVTFHLMATLLIKDTIIKYNMDSCLDVSVPGFYYWIKKLDFSDDSYIVATLVMLCVVFPFLLFYNFWEKYNTLKIGGLFFLSFLWVFIGYKSYEISDTHDHDKAYYEVYEYICKNMEESDSIYYCFSELDLEDNYAFIGIDRIQFLLKEKKINFLNPSEGEVRNNMIMIVRSQSEENQFVKKNYIKLLDNEEFNVYGNK